MTAKKKATKQKPETAKAWEAKYRNLCLEAAQLDADLYKERQKTAWLEGRLQERRRQLEGAYRDSAVLQVQHERMNTALNAVLCHNDLVDVRQVDASQDEYPKVETSTMTWTVAE